MDPHLDFSAAIHIDEGDHTHIFPMVPNISYALGYATEQHILKLGPFLGKQICDRRQFVVYCVGQFLMYDHIIDGTCEHLDFIIVASVIEYARLG